MNENFTQKILFIKLNVHLMCLNQIINDFRVQVLYVYVRLPIKGHIWMDIYCESFILHKGGNQK